MRILLCIALFLPVAGIIRGQDPDGIRESFEEGEYFFSRGDFTEAAYYLKKVVEAEPDNAHFNFMLGECYMNIPGSEALAVPYFEKATQQTVAKNKYKGKDFMEKSAPLHAWFYLGNAYRISNRLEDALRAYDTFINSPFYYGNYNENIVENEIKSCERAKILQDSPVDFEAQLLDTLINTEAAEMFPAASRDGRNLAFIRRLKFYDAILLTVNHGGRWEQPINLNPLIGSDGEFYPTCISDDGSELYLVKRDPDNNDLYLSYRHGTSWSRAEPLSRFVNSMAHETSACLSADKQTLYFVSSRKGGAGGQDIYYSQREKNGQWGKARNAGKHINTPFDEESPGLAGQDNILYFSSKGHFSMGGYDIFYAVKKDKSWSEPVNIGSPINNTSDNLRFVPLGNGTSGYYAGNPASNQIEEDVFKITLKSNLPVP